MTKTLPVIKDCDGCGVCCFHMGYPTFNLELGQMRSAASDTFETPIGLSPSVAADLNRWMSMPHELRCELLQSIADYESPESGQLDGKCTWLDPLSRTCKHHEFRPQVCRDFRVGGAQCRAWRREYSIGS